MGRLFTEIKAAEKDFAELLESLGLTIQPCICGYGRQIVKIKNTRANVGLRPEAVLALAVYRRREKKQ